MKGAEVYTYFGYGVAFIMGCAGIIVLFGLYELGNTPSHFRIIFGVVLILFSIYRFLATRTMANRTGREGE